MPGFRIVDKRHPKPPAPPAPPAPPRPPREPLCHEVVANPTGDGRRCYRAVGHGDPHAWEYCRGTFNTDRGYEDCELLPHAGSPHRVTIEWDDTGRIQ